MAKNIRLTLDDFRKKALQREKDKKLFAFIDVEGFGELKFSRPSDNDILKYMDECARAVKTDGKGNPVEKDLKVLFEASKELVFNTCDYLGDKALREGLGIKDPMDMPSKVFGIAGTIDIAGQIMEEFEGQNLVEEIEDIVKN